MLIPFLYPIFIYGFDLSIKTGWYVYLNVQNIHYSIIYIYIYNWLALWQRSDQLIFNVRDAPFNDQGAMVHLYFVGKHLFILWTKMISLSMREQHLTLFISPFPQIISQNVPTMRGIFLLCKYTLNGSVNTRMPFTLLITDVKCKILQTSYRFLVINNHSWKWCDDAGCLPTFAKSVDCDNDAVSNVIHIFYFWTVWKYMRH